MQAWDLGGHEAVRYLWFDFLTDSHALVFMIDGADEERLEEAHWELAEMLSDVSLLFCNIPDKCEILVAIVTSKNHQSP